MPRARRRRRAEIADLISRLELASHVEQMRAATQALRPAVPSQFLCTITQEIMDDPVTTADGHAYERTSIAQWLRATSLAPVDTSPATGARLPAGGGAAAAHPRVCGGQPWGVSARESVSRGLRVC